MLITAGMFLFNLLCGLVPCEPRYRTPQILAEPRSDEEFSRNLQKRQIEPIVRTNLGIVEGYLMRSTLGREFFAFEGIPYGEDTAKSRWMPPVPKRPWRGVRHAKKVGKECLQISLTHMLRVHGSEDCLTLNIYTPNIPDSPNDGGRYPVVVFIHGGSFLFGSGYEYGPAYMLNEDVIYVSFNYRLGVMGFLSTGDENLPGNYGLKDQALALKWVYENIKSFNGNPNNITLMGNSAGGVSTHLHLISNKTRQYFSSAFSSSGSALHYWGVQSHDRMRYLARKLGQRFGCSRSDDNREFVQCMRRVNSNFLTAAQLSLMDWFPFPPVLLSPTVEPEHPDAFLTVSPEEAYREGLVARKPYIMGVTKDEGKTAMIILLPMMRTFPLRVMWDQIAPFFLQYKDVAPDPKELTQKITEFYFNGTSPRFASLDAFGDAVTDRYLMFGSIKAVQAHVDFGEKPYLYYFSFRDAEHNLANTIGMKASEWGAGHSEDMYYFFNSSFVYDGHTQKEPEAQLSAIMIKLLVNFAKTGEPSFTSETGEVYKIWEPVDNPSELKALKFDKQIEMIPLPENEIQRLQFWDSLKLSDTSLWTSLRYYGRKDEN